MAIIGQCTNPMLVHGRLERQNGSKESLRIIDDVEAYAAAWWNFPWPSCRRPQEGRSAPG